MAGVYIPGISVPISCERCPCVYDGNCNVVDVPGDFNMIESLSVDDYYYFQNGKAPERHPACPLVAVPDHGRVIDIDAAIAKLETKNRTERILARFIKRCVIIGVCKALARNAPTLLPPDRPTD